MKPTMVHGTCVSLNGKAVLIRGAPGSGKSDLALQLIESSGNGLGDVTITGKLIADDQTELHTSENVIWAKAPAAIRGKLEVRGFGIVSVLSEEKAPLVLVVDLKPAREIERLPEASSQVEHIFGHSIVRVEIDPNSASAAARVRLALVRGLP